MIIEERHMLLFTAITDNDRHKPDGTELNLVSYKTDAKTTKTFIDR